MKPTLPHKEALTTLFKKITLPILVFTVLCLISPTQSFANSSNKAVVDLRILETTDIHAALMNYDYYQTKIDNRIGLVKTATLIHQARKEVKNSLLFDDGDHLKGNPLGEYLARIRGLHKGKTHPVYRAFNFLHYDAIAIGNHEFNYGLRFLNTSIKGAKMPVLNANVYSVKTNKPYFTPYVILKRSLVDNKGIKHELKVGVIGFMPTQIMKWDRATLEGKVFAKPIVQSAKEFIPIMKGEGADIIVALAHTGISSEPYSPDTENAVYYLTKIPGIDVVLSGHSHSVFPGAGFQSLPRTNIETGEINGKPVVMAGAFGSRLGIIDLKIEKDTNKWKIVKGRSQTRSIVDQNGKSVVKTDKKLFNLLKSEHDETIDFIKKLGF